MVFARHASALPRQLRPLRLRLPSTFSAPRIASFQTSCYRKAGSESGLHEENRAEKAEAEKQDQLKEQKQGKGQWHPGLASEGEAAVKADQDDKSIKEMQKETEEKAGKRKH